VLKEKS